MTPEDFTGIIQALSDQLEVFTEKAGNQIDGAHVAEWSNMGDEILVQLEDGRQFAITVGEV